MPPSAAPRTASSSTPAANGCPMVSSHRPPPSFRSSAAPPLKDSSRFRLIGKPVARLDTPAKCNGSAIYGIDVNVPGMLNAAIMTAPSFTGQVTAIKNENDDPQDARRARRGEDPCDRLPGWEFQMLRDRRATTPCASLPTISGRPGARSVSLDVAFDGGAHGDLSTAKIDAALDAALNAEHGVTALVRGQPQRDPARRARRRSSSGASSCRTSPMRRTSRATRRRATRTARSRSGDRSNRSRPARTRLPSRSDAPPTR